MKTLIALVLAFGFSVAYAQDKTKGNYENADLQQLILDYSKLTGQKFVVDPGVRGKISIFTPEPVSKEEAFNNLSSALMINGYAISTQNGVMLVRTARNAQRDLIDVVKELPPVAPAKMVTWVYTPKHISVEEINRELRMLQSKDGELSVYPSTNSIMISDFTPNLHRISAILKSIDKPADPALGKIVQENRKRADAWHKMQARKGTQPIPPEMVEDVEMPLPPPPHHVVPPKKGK